MNNYPVILAHGIARFDELRQRSIAFLAKIGADVPPSFDALHYFKGVASHLLALGFDAHQTTVSFAAGIEVRAAELKAEVKRVLKITGHPKAHIIAHSMGGLDARHMIIGHEMSGEVASLTTIGTPHKGTPLADIALEAFGNALIEKLRPAIHLEGFVDLSIERCRRFNAEAEAAEAANSVIYQVFASCEERQLVFAPLQPSWDIIKNSAEGGENDGLVPRSSQLWQKTLYGRHGQTKDVGQHEFPFSADHLNQIGWFNPQQFLAMPLFTLNPLKFIFDYERKVRDIYGEIASGLQQI